MLIHRRQHDDDFAGSDLPAQVFALRFLVDRPLRLRLAGVEVVKSSRRLEIFEHSRVVVVFHPRVGDEQANGIDAGRHGPSVA